MTAVFTTSTAAVELGVTPCRVRAMIAAGRLQATRAGRDWLVTPKSLDAVRDRKPGRPASTHQQRVAKYPVVINQNGSNSGYQLPSKAGRKL
jgi:excisionase family DNA binding protein